MKELTTRLLEAVRSTAPLVHNITNYVVMNSSANILLAAGASPVMAHCEAEVEEMVAIAGALVLNIGTLEDQWVASMLTAAKAARKKGIPVILDPVGAGATTLRTEAVQRIMETAAVSVLRGNASEVLSLGSDSTTTKGVDASVGITDAVVDAARAIAAEQACIVAISGEHDCITDGTNVYRVHNGNPLMARVTGTGCGLSAITGAFCAVADGPLLEAAAAAFGYYAVCGDLAARISDKPGSFAVSFLDCLYAAGPNEIRAYLSIS